MKDTQYYIDQMKEANELLDNVTLLLEKAHSEFDGITCGEMTGP